MPDTPAALCAVRTCPEEHAAFAPMCQEHMIEAWRWVEARPSVRPTTRPLGLSIGTRPPRPAVVYYVRLPGGDIKIGTSTQLRGRVSALRVRPEALLAAEPGGFDLEGQRLAQFASARIPVAGTRQPENFAPTLELLDHIERVRAAHGDPLALARRLAVGAGVVDKSTAV